MWKHFLKKWGKVFKTIEITKVMQTLKNYLHKNLVIGNSEKKVLKLSWSKKRMFLPFEKDIFQCFENFWLTKLKPFCGTLAQSVQNYLNQNLVIGSLVGKGFENILSSNTIFLNVWIDHFSIFASHWVTKLHPVFGKVTQSVEKFELKAVHRKPPRKWFWSSKTIVMRVWKDHFSVVGKFLSDEFETIF